MIRKPSICWVHMSTIIIIGTLFLLLFNSQNSHILVPITNCTIVEDTAVVYLVSRSRIPEMLLSLQSVFRFLNDRTCYRVLIFHELDDPEYLEFALKISIDEQQLLW